MISGSTTKRSYEKYDGIKAPQESRKNAEAGPRQTDHTIYEQDQITQGILEFYTELCDRENSTIIHTDPKVVPEVASWKVEAALRDMKNGTETGNDHINIETLNAGEDTISVTLTKLHKSKEIRKL